MPRKMSKRQTATASKKTPRSTSAMDRSTPRRDDRHVQAIKETTPMTPTNTPPSEPEPTPAPREEPPMTNETTRNAAPESAPASQTTASPAADQPAAPDQPPIQEFPKMIRRSDGSLQTVQNKAEEDQVKQSDQQAAAPTP